MNFINFFKETNEDASLSMMRLISFLIVVTICICFIYLTITSGVTMAPYLITALVIGVTGKAAQKIAEVKK